MTLLNILGSQAVAKAQTVIVYVVLGILALFAVTTLANLDLDLLAFSGYPPLSDIVASVALTFFAFLGFGVVTFTAKDLADPVPPAVPRHLPGARHRHDDLRRGGARRVRHADGRRGDRLGRHGPGGRRRAHPRPGRLLADDRHGAVRHVRRDELGPVPRRRASARRWQAKGQFPPVLGRRFGGRAPAGLLLTAAIAIVLAVGFDLNSIASIGSAIALLVFTLRQHRAPTGPRRDRRPAPDAGAGHPEHRRRPGGLHLHYPRRRARDRGDPGRDPRCQHRHRPGLEAGTRLAGLRKLDPPSGPEPEDRRVPMSSITSRSRDRRLAVAIVAVLLLAACGDDDDGDADPVAAAQARVALRRGRGRGGRVGRRRRQHGVLRRGAAVHRRRSTSTGRCSPPPTPRSAT